ncbi:taurine import ATP-binding tauB domain protein [Escherichia coli DEC6C]|nr:taurine import ATP-binding tauB domain protein [Escherichia coli DEC6C]
MLQISHLYADYGGKPALEDINLTLESGELLVCWGRPAAVKPPC